MKKTETYQNLIDTIDPHKEADKAWFLSLLDEGEQWAYEERHMEAVMRMLRIAHLHVHKKRIAEAKAEIEALKKEENTAENYCKIGALLEKIKEEKKALDSYRCYFEEPYFARMDLTDPQEGYNSYYIGKKGDLKLSIVDWRAPLARKYYQKSKISFSINEYDYKTVLRRALNAKEGKVLSFKNEFLSVKDYLTAEEIGGRDEEILFDPYLREIIKSRKEETGIKDIIRTIQEKQYEIITCPERENFVLQGCAGSGKTMVMLHRLSYLMYNNEDIHSRDVLMITPGDSFNDFIDELTTVLELQRVRTMTLQAYYLQVLKNEKIDLAEKIDKSEKEPKEYLAYLYSPKFRKDVKKKIDKVYDSLYGLFTGEECQSFLSDISRSVERQLSAYEGLKNASLRVRRAVLGEIKEKKEGGLYYTKPFRGLMNCFLDVQDFFDGTLKSGNAKNQAYFYRQLLSFYKSAAYAARHTDKIVGEAIESLKALSETAKKELFDLKRYKRRIGSTEEYVYAERIARREQLLKEIDSAVEKVETIGEENTAFAEFYGYLRGEKNFSALGSGGDFVDVIRFFYRETVRKYKAAFGLKRGTMYASDAYALTFICAMIGMDLTPKHAFVFVDEAQDISEGEYELLRAINRTAAFNVFGDLAQNVTPERGIFDWRKSFSGYSVFELNQNYRNTNQIVEFVSENLRVDMLPTGFDGPSVEYIQPRGIGAFFREKKGLKALICTEKDKEAFAKRSYWIVSEKGRLSKTKINLLTVYESKGLEFTSVAVADMGMTDAEKYIAYTRALKELAVVREEKISKNKRMEQE